jgi:hypothetical protein
VAVKSVVAAAGGGGGGACVLWDFAVGHERQAPQEAGDATGVEANAGAGGAAAVVEGGGPG